MAARRLTAGRGRARPNATPSGAPRLGESIALGAILRYAVTHRVPGIDLQTAGVILMWVGAAGLVIRLLLLVRSRAPDTPPPADQMPGFLPLGSARRRPTDSQRPSFGSTPSKRERERLQLTIAGSAS